MLDIGLQHSAHVPPRFVQKEKGILVLIVAKIVDDLKLQLKTTVSNIFIETFDKRSKRDDVKHGVEKLAF